MLLVTLAAAVGWLAVRLEQSMFPLGVAGPLGIWPVDVYIGLAVLLAGVTLWAIYAVVALLRAAARYGG